MEVFIDQRPVVDKFEDLATVELSPGDAGKPLIWGDGKDHVRTLNGRRARITLVGGDTDPGAEGLINFHLKVNGVEIDDPVLRNFGSRAGVPAVTTDPSARMIVPKEIPQYAYLQICCDLDAAATVNYYAYARLRIEYVDF